MTVLTDPVIDVADSMPAASTRAPRPREWRPLCGHGAIREREGCAERRTDAAWLDDSVRIDHSIWTCEDAEIEWQAPRHLLVLTERGSTARTEVRLGGEPHYAGRDRPGALSFIPAGTERSCAYERADLVYTALWIDPGTAAALAPGLDLARPWVNVEEPVVAALLAGLRRDLERGAGAAGLYVSHLVSLVLHRIAALEPHHAGHDGRAPRPSARAHPLPRPTLVRVVEYIDAHLQAELRLVRLAREAGLQPDSFARRFQASTGVAPYAYVLSRRIARASGLLRSTRREIGDIALAVGFASASHFSSTFRRAVGVSPRAYRDDAPH